MNCIDHTPLSNLVQCLFMNMEGCIYKVWRGSLVWWWCCCSKVHTFDAISRHCKTHCPKPYLCIQKVDHIYQIYQKQLHTKIMKPLRAGIVVLFWMKYIFRHSVYLTCKAPTLGVSLVNFYSLTWDWKTFKYLWWQCTYTTLLACRMEILWIKTLQLTHLGLNLSTCVPLP